MREERKWFDLSNFDLKKLKPHSSKTTYTIKDNKNRVIKGTRWDGFEKCFYWKNGDEALYVEVEPNWFYAKEILWHS